jgi:hypothetical protein
VAKVSRVSPDAAIALNPSLYATGSSPFFLSFPPSSPTPFSSFLSLSSFPSSPILFPTQARTTFLQQTTALRKKVHSSYQRGIANALTRMRTMHLLEDNSCGEHP